MKNVPASKNWNRSNSLYYHGWIFKRQSNNYVARMLTLKPPGKDYTNESVFLHDFHGLHIDGRVWFLQIERNYLDNAEITQNVVVRRIIVLTYLHNFSYVIINQLLRRHPLKVGKCCNSKLIETKCYMQNNILQTAKLYSDIILVSGTREWITWHLIMMGSI